MSEAALIIRGGQPLHGEVTAQYAKNAILPMIAAALIPKTGTTILHGVPEIADVLVALELARAVGARIEHNLATHTVIIDASDVSISDLPLALTEKMRGSVLFMAPLLVRLGRIYLPGSGGCSIGDRKLDFHHRGFARLGATVEMHDDGATLIEVKKKFKGTLLYLDMPSHTGTENLMMGAALADGETIIENASVEPEVVDFGRFLLKMGANIQGLGTSTLIINGVKQLHAVEYTPIPDRLIVGMLTMATGIAGGDILIRNADYTQLRLVNAKLEQMGLKITPDGSNAIRVQRSPRKALSPINITTHPYPGFPTDLQPCMSTVATIATGKSYIRERIFENRYDFVEDLIKMGADILITQGDACVITGVKHLKPARVRAASIRAGAAVLLAALNAPGETTIANIYQIDRGHERIEAILSALGVAIQRVNATETNLEPA